MSKKRIKELDTLIGGHKVTCLVGTIPYSG